MSANFDAQAFMAQTVADVKDAKTEPDLVPSGEYEGVVDKITVKPPKPKTDGSEPWNGVTAAISWEIMDDALRAQMGRAKVIVTQFIPIELDDAGRIAKGGDKNWRLWQVKAAVGQASVDPWNVGQLQGGMAIVRVKQTTYEGNTSSQVDRVAARQ